MSSDQKIDAKSTPSARRTQLRRRLWPDVDDDQVWLRTQRTGFTTIPRTMALIGRLLDEMGEKGFPLFPTYLTLWCWVYDEAIVEVNNPRDFAYESGFSGTRGEATWKNRMGRLKKLGFIDNREGISSEYQFVLLYNPLLVIEKAYQEKLHDKGYLALLNRLQQIGATDIDMTRTVGSRIIELER